MKIILLPMESLKYESNYNVGLISNINNEGCEIEIEQISTQIHLSLKINGVLIQIWCTKYTIYKEGQGNGLDD